MKLPYGISDFNTIVSDGYWYRDRTDRIPLIENAGRYLLFIRPRRFGKSLLLSMLRHYYDLLQKDRFQDLFGHLAIGRNPTPSRNRHVVMRWDFSRVDPTGSVEDIRNALHRHVNSCIAGTMQAYGDLLKTPVTINERDALVSLDSLLTAVRASGHPFYLLIDEYDNFANEVMTGIRNDQDAYKAIVHEKGPLKTLFKAVKSATGEGGIDRIFITGVSPVVLSDITSGFNIAKNIYLLPEFADICGFTEAETRGLIESLIPDPGKSGEALDMMRTYYNGYTFSPDSDRRMYNPTLTLYFADSLATRGTYPHDMLDANLSMDEAKLTYLAELSRGKQMLLDITREREPVTVPTIAVRFGIRDMLSEASKDHAFRASFLYYFGVLTISGITDTGELILGVPNLVTRGLYVAKIRELLLPDPGERDDGRDAAKALYTKGDMAPLCAFIEDRYFRVFHNPDYRWANELTVKTAFLTLLYSDIFYIMDSERETGRGYADLTMIVRPDMRKYALLDVLLEFKYVGLGDAGLTGEKARSLTPEELRAIPFMAERMAAARHQAARYGEELQRKHGGILRLRRYAVVSLGFERLWWEEVS